MSEKTWKINYQIRNRIVSVIDENGKKIGSMILDNAVNLAQSKGMDLVQVSEDSSNDVVCKIADFGRMKYQFGKNKKSNHSLKKKEILISMNISDHDLNTKLNKVREFIDKKYEILFGIKFKNYKDKNNQDFARQKINDCLSLMGVDCSNLKFMTAQDKIFVVFR
jgi:translation initiation factor IF-3